MMLNGQAHAAGTEPSPLLLWLFNLPNEVLGVIVILTSIILSIAIWALISRFLTTPTSSRPRPRSGYYAASVGAVIGAALLLGLAEPWQNYVTQSLTSLPPTAAGPGTPATPGESAAVLLTEPDNEGRALPPQAAQKIMKGRARHAGVNFNALESSEIELNLFDDEVLTAVRDRIELNEKGNSVWVGHIKDSEDKTTEVILVARGQTLMGTVELPGRSFEIVYVKGRTHAVREIDPKSLPANYEPEEMQPNPEADLTGSGTTTQTFGDLTSTGQVIDLMVAYTTKARNNAGGVTGIEGRIINAVTKANQAYINSKIPMQLNIVNMVETNYVETGDMSVTLPRLSSSTDGFMDELHGLRDQYGADQVLLVSADSNYCGYAYIMKTVSTTFASSAFGVVHDDSVYNCLGSNNTLAHELGHNQGNVHNAENTSTAGAYSDSYGYRVCGVFRDIMSYSCQGEVRIPYFSSSDPTLTYSGQPIGIAGSADTSRSMTNTSSTVSSFRQSGTVSGPAPIVPSAPTSLTATATNESIISLTWIDKASDESGFRLERSADGVTWTVIANLTANSTGFSDNGLASEQTWQYRVYAWNSVGNSTYSNMAQATTPTAPVTAPADTTPPTATLSPATGSTVSIAQRTVAVTASGTDNVAISQMTVSLNGKVVSTSLNPGTTGSIKYTWNLKSIKTAGTYTLSTTVTDTSNLSTTITNTVNVTK